MIRAGWVNSERRQLGEGRGSQSVAHTPLLSIVTACATTMKMCSSNYQTKRKQRVQHPAGLHLADRTAPDRARTTRSVLDDIYIH